MAEHGVGVIYISHRLDEVRAVAHKIVCLRDGNLVKTWDTGDVPKSEIVSGMVGRDFVYQHEAPQPPPTTSCSASAGSPGKGSSPTSTSTSSRRDPRVRRPRRRRTHRGGPLHRRYRPRRTRARCRRWTATSGSVRPRTRSPPGSSLVPEDRKGQGLNLGRTSAENIVTPWEPKLRPPSLITRKLLETLGRQEPSRSSTSAAISTSRSSGCPAATSRRCCWRNGWSRAQGAHPRRTDPRRRRRRQDGRSTRSSARAPRVASR